VDFFVVGQSWAHALQSSNSATEKAVILHRYLLWNDIARGIYFPIMLSYLVSSCAFFYATLGDQDRWAPLARLAFALNALRLVGRIASTFGGQLWLNSLNNSAYFPVVLVINSMIATWLFHLARNPGTPAILRTLNDGR
jgi:fatty acid desaturase